jgi:hypothetical protein
MCREPGFEIAADPSDPDMGHGTGIRSRTSLHLGPPYLQSGATVAATA